MAADPATREFAEVEMRGLNVLTREEFRELCDREKTKEAIIARIPLGRAGTPQDIARGVRYLIVDGDYITGATLNINGGAFMQ